MSGDDDDAELSVEARPGETIFDAVLRGFEEHYGYRPRLEFAEGVFDEMADADAEERKHGD